MPRRFGCRNGEPLRALRVKWLGLGPVAAHLEEIEDRRREVQDAFPFTGGECEAHHGREIGQLGLNPVDRRLERGRQLLASRAWEFRRQMNFVTASTARCSISPRFSPSSSRATCRTSGCIV